MTKTGLVGKAAQLASGVVMSALIAGTAATADTHRPECFSPAPGSGTKQYEAKDGPYRLAFVNGFAGNDWRVQAIQSAKAWAARPGNAGKIKEFKVVSVGNDAAAQIAAIDNFIAAGFDAVTFIAVNPTAFNAVISRAERAGTILVPFDNILDTDRVVQVNESQTALESTKAEAVIDALGGRDEISGKGIKILEVRGLPGNSTDRDRHLAVQDIFGKIDGAEIVEVVGNWDTGTSQKVVADALATHGEFDGVVSQHGTAGTINALLAADHPIIPIGGDGENGVRMLMAEHGIPGVSAVYAPAMSAVALEAAVALLEGHELPQSIHLPIPNDTTENFVDGKTMFSDLPKTFNLGTGYPDCFPVFTPEELLGQSPDNN
ncbi:substrate-binding domain-containing protein [Oricola sp.]|uniref:substrate-binding domain-containing protein n=1 Tax=Oricola sp. TaxID=1979950 RepID=UPI003BABE727